MKTIKIKSTDKKTQGDYVIINESDFDESIHSLFKETTERSKTAKKPDPVDPKPKKVEEDTEEKEEPKTEKASSRKGR